MAGTFSKSSLPKRPGAYFNFKTRRPEPQIISTTGIVALAATHSWGPDGQVVELDSWGDFLRIFSQGGTVPPSFTNAYRAVRDAFKGEDLPGYGGAGQVLFYRIAGTSAQKSSHQFSNGTTNALTLTAVYKGTYGNLITATIVANQTNPSTVNDLVIYVDGVEVERYSHAKTNITDLAAQVNGTAPYTSATSSDWVVASGVTSGTALTAVTGVAFTGGDDGTTLTPTQYSAAQSAFEPYRFSVLAFDNVTDSSVIAAQKTWAVNLNAKGKRFLSVVGGAAGESMATAIARSATLDDPNFVNVGGGTFTDPDFGDLSTAQLAPRIAGIIAERGVVAEITFARLNGLTVKVGNTEQDIANALDGGVVAISRDSNPQSPVRLELGVTTYTDNTTAMPHDVYGQIKFVRVMQDMETELTEWSEWNVIGKMTVTAATRDFVRGRMAAFMDVREAAGIIQPGWSVKISNDPAPTPTDNFVALDYEVTIARGLQKVLNTVTVG